MPDTPDYRDAYDDLSSMSGYPVGEPIYSMNNEISLVHTDHFVYSTTTAHTHNWINKNKNSFFIPDVKNHFIRDTNDGLHAFYPVTIKDADGNIVGKVFSGSTTNVNPENDPEKNKILNTGLEAYEYERCDTKSPPISPLQPFTRMNNIDQPHLAQTANLVTYNRIKLPIADVEFRKGFRHVFFTRPECYIMSGVQNDCRLSEQAEYDVTLSSAYSRMPHILKLLSPIYVTGSFSQNNVNSNMNYLLSNRIHNVALSPNTSMGVNNNNISKSYEGHTVITAGNVESTVGGTVDLTFRDTKNLEVYEMLRLWIYYAAKRRKGILAPSYNGYQYRNGFPEVKEGGIPVPKQMIYHPFDRAIEYASSMFDFITNESMTKIIYWCKYYGMYPISVSIAGLTSETGALTSEVIVNSTWRYQYKAENKNVNLVEFNYNMGITDDLGRFNKEAVSSSLPFLLRENYGLDKALPNYVGAAGMFTGAPYVVMGISQNDPLDDNSKIITPYLRFMPITDWDMNNKINLNIDNHYADDDVIMSIPSD